MGLTSNNHLHVTSGRSTRHADQRLGLTAGPATGSRRGDVRESGLG